jgi:hypothetical protein
MKALRVPFLGPTAAQMRLHARGTKWMNTALRSGPNGGARHARHGAREAVRGNWTPTPRFCRYCPVIRRSPAQPLLESSGFSGTIVLTMT